MFLLRLIISSPSPVLVMITDEMNPQTVQETQEDTEYLLGYLARERRALGEDHPRVPCDTAEVGREIASWQHGDRELAYDLMMQAAKGTGRCSASPLRLSF